MTTTTTKRVLLVKLGLDGHDRGWRLIARELRDRGAEVILLGTGTTTQQAAAVAVQEDVDVIAVSLLSGSHMTLIPQLVQELKDRDLDIPVLCGGTIPAVDAQELRLFGVQVFPVGTSVQQAGEAVLAAPDVTSQGG